MLYPCCICCSSAGLANSLCRHCAAESRTARLSFYLALVGVRYSGGANIRHAAHFCGEWGVYLVCVWRDCFESVCIALKLLEIYICFVFLYCYHVFCCVVTFFSSTKYAVVGFGCIIY